MRLGSIAKYLTVSVLLLLGNLSCGPAGEGDRPNGPSTDCDQGLIPCGDACVDLWNDRDHCGACFNECRTDRLCFLGACVISCPEELEECDGSCVDVSSDPGNCGECGFACPPDHGCRAYTCVPPCPPGLTDCGGVCVDTSSDPENCGHCDSRCPEGRVCSYSNCVEECPAELTNCAGGCVDTTSDPHHCGSCGARCPEGRGCVDSVCEDSCPVGQAECHGFCVDLASNPYHCGQCDKACPWDHICLNGSCILDCDPPDQSCDSVPPTVPRRVRAMARSASEVHVSWAPSTDNLGVAGYRLFRDGVMVATTEALELLDTGLTPATTYSYKVAAVDLAGNVSEQSHTVRESTFVGARPARPGKTWVRTHPFTVSALLFSDHHWHSSDFLAAGFNSSHVWAQGPAHPHGHNALLEASRESGLRWHLNIVGDSLTQAIEDQVERVCDESCTQAYYVYDEPTEGQLPGVGQVASYVRENRPKSLVYMSTADFADSYVGSVMTQVSPDVLMYCMYPFEEGGTNWRRHYRSLAQKRKHSLEYDIPFFSWIHAFGGDGWRKPSSSEVRMHLFTSLTAGAKGISYFLWDIDELTHLFTHAIAMPGGILTDLYDEIAVLNPQVERLGEVLKWLTSADLRFVPGENREYGFRLPNTPPDDIPVWTAGAGGIPEIYKLEVASGQYHRRMNGLIGFFEDDTKEKYFMLTNFFCDEGLSPAEASMTFLLGVHSSVQRVFRFNRETGREDILEPGENGILEIVLPGGTGELFCLSPGCFG